MRHFGKMAAVCAGVLLALCIDKRTDASALALKVVFPYLADHLEFASVELPITSEIQETVVDAEEYRSLPVIGDEEEFRRQLAEENQLSFESLLEEEETSRLLSNTFY